MSSVIHGVPTYLIRALISSKFRFSIHKNCIKREITALFKKSKYSFQWISEQKINDNERNKTEFCFKLKCYVNFYWMDSITKFALDSFNCQMPLDAIFILTVNGYLITFISINSEMIFHLILMKFSQEIFWLQQKTHLML